MVPESISETLPVFQPEEPETNDPFPPNIN